ncbi:MAG: Na/Pi cotransporter family protein [Desulfonatronovibrio sp.]
MEALGSIIAGIGVFFVGLKLLSSALKNLAGRKFRQNFSRWVGSDIKAGTIGFFSGFLSQSMSALSFIIGSLVGAGMLPVKRGMLIIIWANAGVGIMIILAVLNIKIAVLFILGLSGLSFAFNKPKGSDNFSQALFGGAMLFFGLIMLRSGAEPLAAMPWFETFLTTTQASYMLSFLAGAILTSICQSSSAISILAISLTQVGILSMEQTMMIIYGTNVGSGVISWILSSGIKGTPRQLIMSQVLFNILTAMIFVPLFYLEIFTNIPLVLALMKNLNLPLEQQAAMVYLFFNWGGAVVLSLGLNPFYKSISRFWPATYEENWSRPKYLSDDTPDTPEISIALLSKEQENLMQHLRAYPQLLIEKSDQKENTAHSLHSSYASISREVFSQAGETVRQHLSHSTMEFLLLIQNKQKQMDNLEELLHYFTLTCIKLSPSLQEKFHKTFVQSLDFLLHTAGEAESSSDVEDASNMIQLTRDKGQVFKSIRSAYLSGENRLDLNERNIFLELTSIFERIVWTLSRIARFQLAQKELDSSAC